MRKEENENNRLVPLRKIANPQGYSTAYLSQLVQQGKLKAEKVGRNYYTTRKWFNRYLEKHARSDKAKAYTQENTTSLVPIQLNPKEQLNLYLVSDKHFKIKASAVSLYKKIAALMAIFILLLTANLFYLYILDNQKDNQGQVAGVAEKYSEPDATKNFSTSSENFFEIKNNLEK